MGKLSEDTIHQEKGPVSYTHLLSVFDPHLTKMRYQIHVDLAYLIASSRLTVMSFNFTPSILHHMHQSLCDCPKRN